MESALSTCNFFAISKGYYAKSTEIGVFWMGWSLWVQILGRWGRRSQSVCGPLDRGMVCRYNSASWTFHADASCSFIDINRWGVSSKILLLVGSIQSNASIHLLQTIGNDDVDSSYWRRFPLARVQRLACQSYRHRNQWTLIAKKASRIRSKASVITYGTAVRNIRLNKQI